MARLKVLEISSLQLHGYNRKTRPRVPSDTGDRVLPRADGRLLALTQKVPYMP